MIKMSEKIELSKELNIKVQTAESIDKAIIRVSKSLEEVNYMNEREAAETLALLTIAKLFNKLCG